MRLVAGSPAWVRSSELEVADCLVDLLHARALVCVLLHCWEVLVCLLHSSMQLSCCKSYRAEWHAVYGMHTAGAPAITCCGCCACRTGSWA